MLIPSFAVPFLVSIPNLIDNFLTSKMGDGFNVSYMTYLLLNTFKVLIYDRWHEQNNRRRFSKNLP